MAISAFWFVYYAVLLGTRLDNLSSEVTALALFSRIGHYLIIAGLWTVTSFLKMVANRYEVVPTGESVE
jgi:succinate-acetate transporter protein